MRFFLLALIAGAAATQPVTTTTTQPGTAIVAADDTWTCNVCGHVYDPAADGGGKAFEDLPDSWVCPICGAPKSAYVKSVLDGKVVYTHKHHEVKQE